MLARMHRSRWGEPAEARSLSDPQRQTPELLLGGLEERSAVALADVSLPAGNLSAALLEELRPTGRPVGNAPRRPPATP